MLASLEPVQRYQAELDRARLALATIRPALEEITAEIAAFWGLLKTAAPTNDEEINDQQIHARTLAALEQRQAELFQQRQAALARLGTLESERPIMTAALIEYLLSDGAETDYHHALIEFQEAAARYRLLCDALIAWNPAAALVKPIPGTTTWTARSPGDALYREQRRLAGHGIHLPLRPDQPVLGPAPDHNIGPPKAYKTERRKGVVKGS